MWAELSLPLSGPELQASVHLYGSEKVQVPRRLEGDKLALGGDLYTREEEIRGEKEGLGDKKREVERV